MENILGANIRKYLDEYKRKNNIKTDAPAIGFLIEQMGKIEPSLSGISEKAVRKWLEGTTFPETDKLIVLSEILDTSIDELLKNGFLKVAIKEELPSWYSSLSGQSKELLYKVLNFLEDKDLLLEKCPFGYRLNKEIEQNVKTAYKVDLGQDLYELPSQNIELLCSNEKYRVNFINTYLLDRFIADIFFKIECKEDDLNIRTDKYYNYEDLVREEISSHRKKHQIELLSQYLKNSSTNVEPEEILKVIDIGYTEDSTLGSAMPLYYMDYPTLDWGDGDVEELGLDDYETKAWNEIPYYLSNDFVLLERYKPEHNCSLTRRQYDDIVRKFEKQIEDIKRELFNEFYENEVIEDNGIVHKVEYFTFTDKGGDTENFYLHFYVKFNLTAKDILQIMSLNYKNNVEFNISNMNKMYEEKKEGWLNFIKLYGEKIKGYLGKKDE